jgi:hypothetical protein
MVAKSLQTYKLSRMLDKRHDHAVWLLSKVVDKVLPEGLPPNDATAERGAESLLETLQSTGHADWADKIETAASYLSLEYLSYLLSVPATLSFTSGDTVLVEDTRGFNLISILTRLQAELKDTRLRLVAPGITFSDACYNYRWRGTIFAFALGARGSGIRAEYVAWHPSASLEPTATQRFSPIRVQHRKNSNERGQTS